VSAADKRLRETEGQSARTPRAAIAILDYGSQYTQLIARRVRESRVYCEIFPHDVTAEELARRNVVGVILSGGPASVYDKDAPSVDPKILDGRVPVLGICYGMHLMAHVLGGEAALEGKREFGHATVEIKDPSGLFEGLGSSERAWMSHGDTVRRLPPGFHGIATTERLPLAAMSDGRTRFAVQFHPEVMHTPRGAEVLRNFLYRVCGCEGDWTPAAYHDDYVPALMKVIKAKAKGKKLPAVSEKPTPPTKVVDLVERLRESLAAAQMSPAPPPGRPAPAAQALRSLKRGMSVGDVERLAGRPDRVIDNGNGWATWDYGAGRVITFDNRGRATSLTGFSGQ